MMAVCADQYSIPLLLIQNTYVIRFDAENKMWVDKDEDIACTFYAQLLFRYHKTKEKIPLTWEDFDTESMLSMPKLESKVLLQPQIPRFD